MKLSSPQRMLAALECAQPMSEMRGVGGSGGKKAPLKFVFDVAGLREFGAV